MKKIIPSLFTIGNLLCGFLAVVRSMEEAYVSAAWWIIIAGIFDALDGKVARLTGTSSEFGIEFDSIADVVSFGMAPAVMFYSYILSDSSMVGGAFAFMFLAAGAFRLARFNITATTGGKHHFTGMPIPSAAGILASYILFAENVWSGILHYDIAVLVVLFTSFAMVSGFKYSVLPKISFATRKATIRSAWFIGLIVLIILYPDEVFFPTGILYLLSGPIAYVGAPAVSMVYNNFHKPGR